MKQLKKYGVILGILLVLSGCQLINGDKGQQIFSKIEDNQILSLTYQTYAGEFEAGTAFCIQTDYSEEPILVTAHHIFGPAGGLEVQLDGVALADFVTGGEVFDTFSFTPTGATIREVIPISDARPVPEVNKDVAAFKLNNSGALNPFKLSVESCKKGDTLYLLADLWDNESVREDGIYAAKVLGEQDGVLFYVLDGAFSTRGASGAPVVNQKGEVVAMHIASVEQDGILIRAGHAASYFNRMIEEAYQR